MIDMKTGIKKELAHKRIKKLLIIGGVILAIALLGFASRYVYLKLRYPEQDVLTGVPRSAIMVAEGKGFYPFLSSLSGHAVWQQGFLTGGSSDHLSALATDLGKISDSGDGVIRSILTEQPFVMSLVPKKEGGPAFLFTIQLPKGLRPATVHSQLRQRWNNYSEKRLLEIRFYERVLPDGTPLYIVIRDGLLIASVDREAFELGYYTLESGNHIAKDESFRDVRAQLSKSQNQTTRVFCSYEGFYTWFARFIRGEKKPLIASLPNLGTWGAFDLAFDDEELHLQGFTGTGDDNSALFQALPEAGRVLDDPGAVLPAGTLFYDQMAVPSFSRYMDDYVRGYRMNQKGVTPVTYPVSASLLDTVERIITGFSPESVTLAATDLTDTLPGGNYLLFIQASQAARLHDALRPFTDTLQRLQYQEFVISPLSVPYLVPALFGSLFQSFENAFLSTYEDYLIIAPTQGAMLSALNGLTLGRTLGSIPSYQRTFSRVQGQMSRRLYLDRKEGENYLRSLMEPSEIGSYDTLLPYLPQQCMLSFAKEGGILLTDMILHANPLQPGAARGGEIVLDAPLSAEPLLIHDHRSNEIKVIAADQSGYLYMMNQKGEIEWKISATEQPLSELLTLDLYKNGRQQCLFFSRNMLHLVQIDGKYVPGFPVAISAPFQRHLSLIDYDANGNFRFMYLDQQQRVSNIDIAGKMVPGWNQPQIPGLSGPVKLLKSGGQDFLLLRDTAGVVHFHDRRGRERFSLPAGVQVHSHSEILQGNWGGSTRFIFLDRNGALQRVSPEGALDKTAPLQFQPGAWLIGFSKEQGGQGEIAVIEPNGVTVLDSELKTLRKGGTGVPEFQSLRKSAGNPSALFCALDKAGVPYMMLRSDFRQFKITEKSYDYVNSWKDPASSATYCVVTKGTVVFIRRL